MQATRRDLHPASFLFFFFSFSFLLCQFFFGVNCDSGLAVREMDVPCVGSGANDGGPGKRKKRDGRDEKLR